MDQLNSNTDIISRKRGKHLSLDERGTIQVLHSQGQSLRVVARRFCPCLAQDICQKLLPCFAA